MYKRNKLSYLDLIPLFLFGQKTAFLRLSDGDFGAFFDVFSFHVGFRLHLLQLIFEMGDHFVTLLNFHLFFFFDFHQLPLEGAHAFAALLLSMVRKVRNIFII